MKAKNKKTAIKKVTWRKLKPSEIVALGDKYIFGNTSSLKPEDCLDVPSARGDYVRVGYKAEIGIKGGFTIYRRK